MRYASEAGIPAERFDVLYNGVDCYKFRQSQARRELRNQFGYNDRQVVILTVASLSEIKNHSSLLVAAAKVVSESAGDPLFVFIGEGQERSKLAGEIEKLGLTDVVIMAGARDDVPDHLAASDIFVLPSKLEGMSNAILEAMACGLPVIANAVGGNLELVNTGETGILTPPDSTDSLAQAIGELIADESARRKMGNEGRRRAQQIFSIDTMLERYQKYYLDLAASAERCQAGLNSQSHRD
jgi:glycosyltransferase involved in cell wall biosynthesis